MEKKFKKNLENFLRAKNFSKLFPYNILHFFEHFWSKKKCLPSLGLNFFRGGGLGGGGRQNIGEEFSRGDPKNFWPAAGFGRERGEYAFGGQYSKSGQLGSYRKCARRAKIIRGTGGPHTPPSPPEKISPS